MRKLGIVIPSYKSKNITRAITSCIECDYENTIVYVVIDDGIGSKFEKKTREEIYNNFLDYSVIVTSNKYNLGAAASRNVGVKMAFKDNCDTCLFLDSDDKIVTNAVKPRIDLMNKLDCKIVYSDYYNYDENSDQLPKIERKPNFVFSELLKDNFISCLSMFDTKLYLQVGGMNENLTYCEDWLLWLKMSQFTVPIHYSKACFYYYNNPDSLTRNVDWNIYGIDKQIAMEDFKCFSGNGDFNKLKDLQNQKILYLRSKNV